MGFLSQLSERFLRVLAQHVNNTNTLGTPCLLRGVAVVAAFSGYSFGLQQKSNSPAVRIPQGLTRSMYQIELILETKAKLTMQIHVPK